MVGVPHRPFLPPLPAVEGVVASVVSKSVAGLMWGSRAGMARLHVCGMQLSILVFIRRDTARYRSKGYNGSNSHPKAGLSWPMAYPYLMVARAWWCWGRHMPSPGIEHHANVVYDPFRCVFESQFAQI